MEGMQLGAPSHQAINSKAFNPQQTCEDANESALCCEVNIPVSMVEAWYFNPSDEDPKLPHKFTPNRPVPRQHLDELGMMIWRLDADKWEKNEMLETIKKERGYNYWDIVTMDPSMADYEEKVNRFFTEHLHADEEIRFLLEGGGYWDIRDHDEKWIRFRIEKGDLVVLPPGMYHRFTLDANNHAKAMRLFKGLPCWTQHERPADNMQARKVYMQNVLKKVDTTHVEGASIPTHGIS
ncbi:hypothetical protein GOP47_0027480 [Adiantum capillus-veneris]|nr:hypothetical protein GOP47_0027480 [Adiantum capillus-veneris]